MCQRADPRQGDHLLTALYVRVDDMMVKDAGRDNLPASPSWCAWPWLRCCWGSAPSTGGSGSRLATCAVTFELSSGYFQGIDRSGKGAHGAAYEVG